MVDDEVHSLRVLSELLREHNNLNILAEVSDPLQATSAILGHKPDLLFMDIQMPLKSGFEILQEISMAGFEPQVIFVTAFEQYVVEAIRHAAFDYLLKPVQKQELYQALFRFAITYAHADVASSYKSLIHGMREENIIRLNTQSGFYPFSLDEVLFIRTDWNFTRVYTSATNYRTVVGSIGSIAVRLPEERFVRLDRNTIINTDYLAEVDPAARRCVLSKEGDSIRLDVPKSVLARLEGRMPLE